MTIRILTLSAALLVGGGCVSYSYHSGYGGDYYSGAPSVEYRYVSPGGYYSYSPYWYGGYGYYGVPYYYGHRYHGGYGYGGGYPWWGSPYYYGGGAWGYNHGPYRPPPVTPPVVTPPPRTVRYLDTAHDARRYPGHREGAGGRYGVPPPPTMADRGQYSPSRPISPPPQRPISPPPQLISPPPSTPRVPPARPRPPTPAPPAAPSARSDDKATPYSPKGATRSRSRYLDPNDP